MCYVHLSGPATANVEDDGPASIRDCLVFLEHAAFVSSYSVQPLSESIMM